MSDNNKEAIVAKTWGHNKSMPDPFRRLRKLERKARPAGRLISVIETQLADAEALSVAA